MACFALLYPAVWQEAKYAVKFATNLTFFNLISHQGPLVVESYCLTLPYNDNNKNNNYKDEMSNDSLISLLQM